MNNNSHLNSSTAETPNAFIAHFNLITIGLGVIGNTICFLIFRLHHSFNRMSSMVYLSFVAVIDTLALFEWNLDHFIQLNYNIDMLVISIPLCRICEFVQYTCLQSSALILSMMCIDRYVTVAALPGSMLHKLPFRTNRSALFWSIGILTFAILLNSHLLFLLGTFELS